MLPESILAEAGSAFRDTEGETAVKDLRSRYVDLVGLDVERLTNVARILDCRIRSGDKVVQFTQAQLMTLVTTAIAAQRLDANDLNETLRKKLPGHPDAPPS